MKIKVYQVDAFASKPFSGNPAAVCLLEEALSPGIMQAIAAENNLPMTAFLLENGDGFSLSWFNPRGEAALCGHATLASAHVLFETGRLTAGVHARFHTRAGLLSAEKKKEQIELDFPLFEHEQVLAGEIPGNISTALGQPSRNAAVSEGWYIIELESGEAVRNTRPDFSLLKNEKPVIITGKDSGKYDFISRFFAPSHGEDEDPVTGSAHCRLAPYWQEKLHKNEFFAFQASPRGGELYVKLEDGRVKLGGQAVTIMEGHLHL